MLDRLFTIYRRLLTNCQYKHKRFLFDSLELKSRLTGLVGPRGTGKTTLMLQYIQEKIDDPDKAFYASMDSIYFSQTNIVEFVTTLYEEYGIRYFFLDEIHKYPNWNQELKNIYDSFPDIFILFSGSSSLDLVKGNFDLSRRGVIKWLPGLSFREYLKFKNICEYPAISLDDILTRKSEVEKELVIIDRILGHFHDYLKKGYFPFSLNEEGDYTARILNVINKTIYEDISNFYKLKTEKMYVFKKIISYLATIPPGELSRNSISKNLGVDNKTVQNYLKILDETGLATLVNKDRSGSQILKEREKMFLSNSDFYYSLSEEIGFSPKIGAVREVFFLSMLKNCGYTVFYSDIGDFSVKGNYFEVGGRNKTAKQVKSKLNNSYLVKDDILVGTNKEIPLYLLGFLY